MNKTEWAAFAATHSERDGDLLTRCYDVLMGNLYEADGRPWSPYRCITPGKTNFPGIWNWDSAFHAVGLAHWDVALARESILGFLQFQREDGLLPDVVWENGNKVDTFSKPPVFAWATEIVYKAEPNLAFLQEVYPKLVLNEAYWVEHRCDGGLFYYDADHPDTADYLTRVKYESGWDNSPRWDNGITNYWAIDLSCFMVMFYRSLAYIAGELGQTADGAVWREKEAALTALINDKMWDDRAGAYFDTDRETEQTSGELSPASFMPLYIGIATPERATATAAVAEKEFRGGMATVPFAHPAYSNDYWRGPTWINVAYFAAKGLKNYGCAIADTIKETVLEMCYREKGGIYENYDSVTGAGLYCDHFSWSCVFINEFILNF